jgi:hypothetical protein
VELGAHCSFLQIVGRRILKVGNYTGLVFLLFVTLFINLQSKMRSRFLLSLMRRRKMATKKRKEARRMKMVQLRLRSRLRRGNRCSLALPQPPPQQAQGRRQLRELPLKNLPRPCLRPQRQKL